jgi:hypothetical protein
LVLDDLLDVLFHGVTLSYRFIKSIALISILVSA